MLEHAGAEVEAWKPGEDDVCSASLDGRKQGGRVDNPKRRIGVDRELCGSAMRTNKRIHDCVRGSCRGRKDGSAFRRSIRFGPDSGRMEQRSYALV